MDVPVMSLKRTLGMLTLATLLAAAPVSAQKRRSVSPPSNPEVIPMTHVVPLTGDPVSVTAAKEGKVIRCLETRCVVDAIKPNQTLVYENLPADQMYAIQAPEGSEVRSGIEPFPISSFDQNHVLPTYDPNTYNMRVGIVALKAGAVDVRFLADNGVQRDVRNFPLKRGINFINPAEFSLSGNQQLELNAPAFIELTHKQTGKKTYLPAKPLASAIGEQYLPFVTADSMATYKNVNAGGIGAANNFFLPGNQNNPNITEVMPIVANNYGVETRSGIAKGTGAVIVRGAQDAAGYTPVIEWGIVNGDYMPVTSQYARARSAQLGDTTVTTDLSFAGLPSGATIYLVSRDVGTGIVKVTDVDGKPVKDIPFNLMTNDARSVALSELPTGTYKALVQLNESSNDYRPQVAGVAGVPSANGVDYREGIAVVRATPETQYEMTTEIGVWANGQQLYTKGTTTDKRLMQIVTGSNNLDSRIGFFGYANNNPNYQQLQQMTERINAGFSPEDYRTVFDESQANLAPFFIDTDGDKYVIDAGSSDFVGDNTTAAPGNQANGVISITYKITKTN
jgi:hypothetical protein